MDTFNQTLSQPAAVKEEVSDEAFTVCEHTDDESASSPLSGTKREVDELDSEASASGTVLPPRKRAKTQEEKEQRRIERVMRNRQAAHASREKKRRHLEKLEQRCADLEAENSQFKGAAQRCQDLQARVEQLETVISQARLSGDLSAFDSVLTNEASVSWPSGPTAGSTLSSSSKDSASSPAPSLEDDCASPEALFLHRGDVSPPRPRSPEYLSHMTQDPFEPDFSLESNIFTSADIGTNPESSSKSRHPAAVTPPHEGGQWFD